jgi:hypothetical protein
MRLMIALCSLGLLGFPPAIKVSAQANQVSLGQISQAVSSSIVTEKYFRDCTPVASATHDCETLERLYSRRLREMDEKPLDISTHSDFQVVYRLSYATPVAPRIGLRLARIEVKNDLTVEILAKTEDMNDKILTSRVFRLSSSDASKLLALLRWEEFVQLDSLSHIPIDHIHTFFDGDYCALEGFHGGEFHAVSRSQIGRDVSLDQGKKPINGVFNLLNSLGAWQVQ